MGFSQKLALKQGQSLVMTPQLSQSIKLLTLSNIELAAFVESEIERNPFLETDSRTEGLPDENRANHDSSATNESAEQIRDVTSNTELETSAQAMADNLGTNIENIYPDEQDYRAKQQDSSKPEESYDTRISGGGIQVSDSSSSHDFTVADYKSNIVTLRDHLGEQLAMAGTRTEISAIVADMIDNLDDAGYLRTPLDEIADRLGCDQDEATEALKILQGFEPVGVGARELTECLQLQLKDLNRLDPAMASVIDNLDLLAKRDFASLQKISGLEPEDLHDALLEIQALDPKPGTAFESSPVQHVVPDVFVTEAPDGSWKIELNAETLPRVLTNNTYASEVKSKLNGDSEKEFMADCLQTANWLTKSLDQRANTILKVATEIVKRQDEFLVRGVRFLRPLTLQMVADEIDMHESTVSRVTSNKYVMTPRGLFELKYFFTTSIAGTSGEEGHSSEAVRDQIRRLIDNETAQTILSDDAIVETLKASGIDIARRTIAKYRDAMHIPSSVQRRREKRAQQQSSDAQAQRKYAELAR